MGNIIKVSDDTFESEVIKSDKLTVVDFWAEWCAPCRMIAPILEELASEHGDNVKITKLNVDENPKTPGSYGINSIPTIYFYKNGEVVDKVVGALPKAHLADKIQAHS